MSMETRRALLIASAAALLICGCVRERRTQADIYLINQSGAGIGALTVEVLDESGATLCTGVSRPGDGYVLFDYDGATEDDWGKDARRALVTSTGRKLLYKLPTTTIKVRGPSPSTPMRSFLRGNPSYVTPRVMRPTIVYRIKGQWVIE